MCLSLRRRRGGRAACSSAPGAVTRSLASIEQLLRSQILLFKYNAGALDITTGRTPDSDTLYCIASLSKAFMAASLDLLVQEDKISWGSTIHSVIPEFQHAQQPAEYSGMTVRDICSHRTGLLGLDEITQGLDGRILIDKNDMVKVCRAMPSKHDLRSNFLYNNGLFELAGHLVERVSGYSNWGDFQNAYIFEPLGMERTSALRDVHETDKNIAKPYIVLTDGTPFYILPTELSADSMNGGSGGLRSSVNNLLKWSQCLLSALNGESGADDAVRHASPIFNRCTIASPEDAAAGDYCTGWCHHRTPAELGLISPNRTLRVAHLGFRFTVPSPQRPPGGCPWIHLQHLHHPPQQLGRRRSL